MTKIEYFKACLAAGLGTRLAWVFSAFALTRQAADSYTKDPYPYRLVPQPWGYQYVGTNGVLVDIQGTDPKAPLFSFQDVIDVDPTWAPNIKGHHKAKLGVVLFNHVVLVDAFGDRLPFPEVGHHKLSVSALESYIAPRLETTPPEGTKRDHTRFYVDEYLRFRDNLQFMEHLAPITSWSATRKGIVRAPGVDELKKKLQGEYGDRLNDPVVLAEYEGKLKDFDKEWLKDDPAYGTFIKGKILDISRKKLFLDIGIEDKMDVSEPNVAITQCLEDGVPTDPKQFAAVVNGSYAGSYSRGTETINGGVVAKNVIRVGSNFEITPDDCGVNYGLTKFYDSKSAGDLVGRTVIQNQKSVKVENNEDAANYLGRVIMVRSPATCRKGPGDKICQVCAGDRLSLNPKGLIIPFTEVSNIVLTASLKSMHGKVLSTADVDLDQALS